MAQTHHYYFDTGTPYNDKTGVINITNTSGFINTTSGKINQAWQGGNPAYTIGTTASNLLPSSGSFSVAFWILTNCNTVGANIFFTVEIGRAHV